MQTIEMPLSNHDGSDVVLAQSVAADSDWLIEAGKVFDADGVEIGGSLAELGVKMRALGWFVRPEAHAPGVQWNRVPQEASERAAALRSSLGRIGVS